MTCVPNESLFQDLSEIPLDPHYALKELFRADTHPKKVILGSGLYRDDNSEPWVLPTVQKAEEVVKKTQDSGRYEYLPISGLAPFVSAARQVLFGPLGSKEARVVSLQTISGTGANFLGAKFLAETLKPSAVWLSDPSWVNHANIWGLAGVQVRRYPYWDATNKLLDFEHMIQRLETAAAPGDVVLLHACAHNPTGVDPTKDQWTRVADVCEKKGLFPFFDCAYQGFASGDLAEDAWAVRHFLERDTLEMAVAQSFSKNMGLYGERVGALHLLCRTSMAADKAKGHLSRFQRGQISQPPTTGAGLAATILSDPELFQEWLLDLREMSGRIRQMREALHDELVALGTPGRWDHVISQIGMFSYTGLTPEQVVSIQENSHVYILKSGRISVAGLNTKNVKHVAEAIDAVVRTHPF
ncbi:Aspartate/other aminotransferase [Metarhizium guizhouense ARSEF 977]|uniref:Aspartate aminotransferase n=1 Tax=Metarhizium guizhouense (strain ARSEF 977) TaxID=1276136 RepID=A0A0B4HNM5_METGA|nr:Aspartate/other aminotransferase [Metarhizium guizhouense ARSEF 977]